MKRRDVTVGIKKRIEGIGGKRDHVNRYMVVRE